MPNFQPRIILVAIMQVGYCLGVSAATFMVTTTADGDDGVCDDGHCTLREAINAANDSTVLDTILFEPEVTGTIAIDSMLPIVTEDLTIGGPGADLLAIDGGGSVPILSLWAPEARLTILGLELTNGNASSNPGGCMTINGEAAFSGVILSNCQAYSGGGAIFLSGSLDMIACRLSGNTAKWGGAIDVTNPGTTLIATDCSFSDNTAEEYGGAIAADYQTTVTIESSAFSGNTATSADGGAIHSNALYFTVSDSTFFFNSADNGSGGAIINKSATVRGCTIAGNTAASGGGVSTVHSVQFSNTIIADNVGGDCNALLGVTGDHNLDSDGTCGFTGAGDLPFTDPELHPLTDNGGRTKTMMPSFGSPVIDHGDSGLCTLFDQRGVERPQDGDNNGVAVCDIGAVEPAYIFADGFEPGNTSAWSGTVS